MCMNSLDLILSCIHIHQPIRSKAKNLSSVSHDSLRLQAFLSTTSMLLTINLTDFYGLFGPYQS